MATATTAVRETEQQLRQRIGALEGQRTKIESELKAASDSVEQAKAKRAETVAALLSSSPGGEQTKIHSTVDTLITWSTKNLLLLRTFRSRRCFWCRLRGEKSPAVRFWLLLILTEDRIE